MGLFSRSKPLSHFPVVKGARLDGTDVSFPQDLPADATLLVVAFRDDLDPLADQWARLGDRLQSVYGDRVATLELPVVSSKLKFFGNLATIGIRGQVNGDDERARTVPIFVDTKSFRKKLRVKTSDVSVYLVARDGKIAWTGEGDIDMDEVQELEQAVELVLAAPVPAPTDHPDLDAPGADLDEVPEPEAPTDEAATDDAPTDATPAEAASDEPGDAPERADDPPAL